jgi:hypothetical protein
MVMDQNEVDDEEQSKQLGEGDQLSLREVCDECWKC